MRTLLFALLLTTPDVFQDPELVQLAEQLGDGNLEVREKAAKKLEEAGPRAYEILIPLRQSPDAEVRLRVGTLLAQYDRDLAQKRLEQQERPKRLRLITLQMQDTPLADVLVGLGEQMDVTYKTKEMDLDRKISISVKEMPLIQVLDQLGLGYDRGTFSETLAVSPPPKLPKYIPGARFTFEVKPWEQEGKRRGFVFVTHVMEDCRRIFPKYSSDFQVDWEVGQIKTDHELKFETCDLHSPREVYVPDPDLREATLVVRGTRRWYCDTPVAFNNPTGLETWKSGLFSISLQWPSVVVRTGKPMSKDILHYALTRDDLTYTMKPGKGAGSGMSVGGSGGGGHYGGRFGGKNAAWCGCVDKPTKGTLAAPETAQESVVPSGCPYPIEDVETLTLNFHKLIEEPFEVQSAPLQ